jgi:hypothetical protein
LKFLCEEGGDAIDRRLVVAGGFDFDQLFDRLNDARLMLGEMAETVGPWGIGCFLVWHNSLSLFRAARNYGRVKRSG